MLLNFHFLPKLLATGRGWQARPGSIQTKTLLPVDRYTLMQQLLKFSEDDEKILTQEALEV